MKLNNIFFVIIAALLLILIVLEVKEIRIIRTEIPLDDENVQTEIEQTEVVQPEVENIEIELQESTETISDNFFDYKVLEELLDSINSIKSSSEKQFRETKKMKEEFDQILMELKNKTVDIASQDSTISNMKKEAFEYFEKQEYQNAYRCYKSILVLEPEDLEVRFKKMKSLFNANPADSSKYPEILEDCNILTSNGYVNPDIEEIERSIMFEKGELNE